MLSVKTIRDIVEIIEEYFSVETKDSRIVPFILNEIQKNFVNSLDKIKPPVRIIILKGRQFGFSTLILIIFLVKCLFVNNTRAVIISHTEDSAKKLFRRIRFFVNFLVVKPVIDKESEKEYSFPRTNSYIYIGTAGTKAFGRGDNLTDVHCSEVAFWDNAGIILNGLIQAVGLTGNIIIETTANGFGNLFHKLWKKSYKNINSAWTALFYKWTKFNEYEMDAPSDFQRTNEEERLCLLHPELNDRKLQWRRWKISEMEAEPGFTSEQIFQQEYPLTPQEAFISSGKGVFNLQSLDAYKPIDIINQEDGWQIWKAPSGYSNMGIDVAEGLENNDRSVIDIYDENMEQAAQWAGWCDTDELAEKAILMANRYKSYIVCEINGPGIAVQNVLRNKYPRGKQYHREIFDKDTKEKVMKLGWRTSTTTKPRLVANLSEFIREHKILFNSPETIDECLSFVRDGRGKTGATEGANDDRVISAGLALQGYIDRPPNIKILTKEGKEKLQREEQNKKWHAERRKKAKLRRLKQLRYK